MAPGAAALKRWKQVSISGALPSLNGFYSTAMVRMLQNGDYLSDPKEGDVIDNSSDTPIEVKSASSIRAFVVPLVQLQFHKKLADGFPYENYTYGFFSYEARESRAHARQNDRKRRSLLQSAVKKGHAVPFLGGRTTHAWLMSIETVLALKMTHRRRVGHHFPSKDEPGFSLSRQMINGLPHETRRGTFRRRFGPHWVTYPFTVIGECPLVFDERYITWEE